MQALARKLMGEGQRSGLSESSHQNLTDMDVPAHLIEECEQEPLPTSQDQEEDELPQPVTDENGELVVFRELWLAMAIFSRACGHWQYRVIPAGFGSLSEPVGIDWQEMARIQQRTPQYRQLSEREKDTLELQLEAMAQAALNVLQTQFKTALKRAG